MSWSSMLAFEFGEFLITTAALTWKSVIVQQPELVPPPSYLPGTDVQLFAYEGIGYTFFAGPFQGRSFKLRTVTFVGLSF